MYQNATARRSRRKNVGFGDKANKGPLYEGRRGILPKPNLNLPYVKGGGTAKRSDRDGGIVCIDYRFVNYPK